MRLFCLVFVTLMSCQDFLDQPSQTALTRDEALGNLDNAEPLLLGAITNWRNTRKDRPGFIVTLGTDEGEARRLPGIDGCAAGRLWISITGSLRSAIPLSAAGGIHVGQ